MLEDFNNDDESPETEPAEKELNGAGVEESKKDCCPKLNGDAEELTKPS